MPFKPNQREYRSFQMSAAPADADNEQSYIVEGYATTFDDPYELYDEYFEVIDRSALADADMSDVIFQLNHEGQPMARNRNNTLSLMCDDHGILVRADLGGSQAGRELYEAIKSGLVDRMSWGFSIAKGGWKYDESTHTSTITKVAKVFDVSAVSRPANEGTEIKARSYLDGVIEAERQELSQREKDMGERERMALLMEVTR